MQKLSFLIATALVSLAGIAQAENKNQTPAEIRQLIDAVGASGCEFERNGKNHPAPEAAEHLEKKLGTAARSWFAPDRDKWTAEMFIEKIATGSSLSGDPYWIICKDKEKIRSAAWLTEKLKDLRAKNTGK